MKIGHSIARVHKLVKEPTIRVLEGFFDDPKRIFQMRQRARTNNGRGDAWLVFDPQQRQLGGGQTAFLRHPGDCLTYLNPALGNARLAQGFIPSLGARTFGIVPRLNITTCQQVTRG